MIVYKFNGYGMSMNMDDMRIYISSMVLWHEHEHGWYEDIYIYTHGIYEEMMFIYIYV